MPYFNYSVAEAGLCIIMGSVPALRPLLATILPNFVETYNLDNLMESAKGNIRRATSRPATHRRAMSDAASDMSPQQSNTATEHGWSEADKTERKENENYELSTWSSSTSFRLGLLRRLRLATVDLLERLRGSSREELARGRRGRPLSVINELDEASEEHERKVKISALRHSVADMFKTRGTTSMPARVKGGFDAARPATWLHDTASTDNIVVTTEITVTDTLTAAKLKTSNN